MAKKTKKQIKKRQAIKALKVSLFVMRELFLILFLFAIIALITKGCVEL